jgi:topoisomerase-4 subunit A
VVSVIYYDAKAKLYYAKRFLIETQTLRNKFLFIREGEGNYLQLVTTVQSPEVLLKIGKKKTELTEQQLSLAEEVEVTGWKTVGTKVADGDLKEAILVNPPDNQTGAAPATLF